MKCGEKPLLKIGDKTMLERVLNALSQSKLVDHVVVAVSANTPQTASMAQKLDVQVLRTPGADYVSDMRYAITKLHLGETLVLSADLPFLAGDIVDRAIEAFRASGKPSLSVMAPASLYKEMGSKPQHVFQIHGRELVPIGLNLVDGKRINELELDQTILEVESKKLLLNVNTPSDYELAKQFQRTRRTSTRE
jgi:adenosylcobinamide-phosphate guanylyltransferase